MINLLGLGLVSICLFMLLLMTLGNLTRYWRSSGWVQESAKINALKITNAFGSDETANWSSTDNNFLCDYTYIYNGQSFSGKRSNIETFTQDSERLSEYNLLKSAQEGNKSVTIWVNPEIPTESVLFRGHNLFGESYILAGSLAWFGALLWHYKFKRKTKEPK